MNANDIPSHRSSVSTAARATLQVQDAKSFAANIQELFLITHEQIVQQQRTTNAYNNDNQLSSD